MRRRLVLAPIVALAAVAGLAACGSDRAAPPTDAACTPAQGGAITVVAKNIQFEQQCTTTVAGRPLKVTFDNRDSGTPHDWVLSAGSSKADTGLISGPKTATVTVPALKPGSYTYICTVHSNMSGTLKVTAADASVSTLPGG